MYYLNNRLFTSAARSDKSTSYFNIEDYVEAHITTKSNKKTTVEVLKWVHIAISNAKRNFLGIYHRINGNTCKAILMNSSISLIEGTSSQFLKGW